jgi:hypothetical protein
MKFANWYVIGVSWGPGKDRTSKKFSLVRTRDAYILAMRQEVLMIRRQLIHGVIVCLTAATAFAGADQPSANRTQNAASKKKVVWVRRSCYVLLSGSPFPQPCERLGAQPSTAIPMTIIGEPPRKIVRTQVVASSEK